PISARVPLENAPIRDDPKRTRDDVLDEAHDIGAHVLRNILRGGSVVAGIVAPILEFLAADAIVYFDPPLEHASRDQNRKRNVEPVYVQPDVSRRFGHRYTVFVDEPAEVGNQMFIHIVCSPASTVDRSPSYAHSTRRMLDARAKAALELPECQTMTKGGS